MTTTTGTISATTFTHYQAARAARAVDYGDFPVVACEFAAETGSSAEVDVAAMLRGDFTPESFTAFCLEGADDDRVAGARAYATAVADCAERARALFPEWQ